MTINRPIRYIDPGQILMKIVLALLVAAIALSAQVPAPAPRYEVASIKPSSDNDLRYTFDFGPGGSLEAAGITLRRLLMTAYNVQGFRILGGPDWLDSRRWQLRAKPDRAATPHQFRPMLRALLEERFQIHTHSETRRLPVYELLPDSKGPRVPAATDPASESIIKIAPGSIHMTNITPSTFASQLSYSLGEPVINETNLSGNFDFALVWTPQPREDGGPTTAGLPPGTATAPPPVLDGPSIFTAIREQLGLRLKSGRGPVAVIVIDSLQLPAAN